MAKLVCGDGDALKPKEFRELARRLAIYVIGHGNASREAKSWAEEIIRDFAIRSIRVRRDPIRKGRR